MKEAIRVHCANCHADFADLESMPDKCPKCKSKKLLEIASEMPMHPYVVTFNDIKFLKDRGIARD